MKRILLGSIPLLLASASVACSGTDASSDDINNRAVNQLTTEEALDICEQNFNTVQSVLNGLCTAAAATDNRDDPAGCDADKAQCLSEQPMTCAEFNLSGASECPFTVREFLSCMNKVNTWISPITCTTDLDTVPREPDCSLQLQDKCQFE